MAGRINVGRPRRIKHIPLSWDVNKARSNHQPKFRPVGDAILRGREKTVGQIMEQMFMAMPPALWVVNGKKTEAEYFEEARQTAEPYVQQIAAILQPTFNEGSLMQQDRIRAEANTQLKRLRSPLRLTNDKGLVTKAVQEVGGIDVGKNPKAVWAPIGIEAFDEVNSASVQYAQFRSGTLVTAMLDEQQRVIRELIGESFTTAQTFNTGRTVTGLTVGQTSRALLEVLEEMNPTTSLGQSLAQFRSVNAGGLTHPWEKAVFHRAEKLATSLADRGITGAKAYAKIQTDTQKYANKLRRSRARMISRTEIKRAQVEGQLASMREALDSGLADPATAGKKWITGATDVCNICSDLGFSRAIHIDQSFEGVGDGPPAHPNCRCDLDFSHKIKEAPKAVGAGNPNFPAGTPENPIVWQFNSGFQTQPNVTTRFMPPSVPTVPLRSSPDLEPSETIEMVEDVQRGMPAFYDDVPKKTDTGAVYSDTMDIQMGRTGKPAFPNRAERLNPALESLDEAVGLPDSMIMTGGKNSRKNVTFFRYRPETPKEFSGIFRPGMPERTLKRPFLTGKLKVLKKSGRGWVPVKEGMGFDDALKIERQLDGGEGRAVNSWYYREAKKRDELIYNVGEESLLEAGKITEPYTYDFYYTKRHKTQQTLDRMFAEFDDELAELWPRYQEMGYDSVEEFQEAVYKYQKKLREYDVKKQAIEEGLLELTPEAEMGGNLITIYNPASRKMGSIHNTIYHEVGHDIDFRKQVDLVLKNGETKPVWVNDSTFDEVAEHFMSGTLAPVAQQSPEVQAVVQFLEEVTQSIAFKNIPAVYSDPDFIEYLTSAVELWGRAFNQWVTTRHGTAEAVEEMLKRVLATNATPIQWHPVEFDEIVAPAVERVLKAWGMIE